LVSKIRGNNPGKVAFSEYAKGMNRKQAFENEKWSLNDLYERGDETFDA